MIAPTTGTPHLQCYLHVNTRIQNPRNYFNLGSNWEICRNPEKAKQYCKKGNQSHEEWTSLGAEGPSYGLDAVVWEIINENDQGARTDIELFKQAVDEANGLYTYSQALVEHSEIVAKYSGFVKEYINLKRVKKEVEGHPLRPWQQNLLQIFHRPPDPRKNYICSRHNR